jgi:hypothetical protein
LITRIGTLFRLAAPLGLPFRPQRGAIDFLSPQVNLADLARIADILERIRVEDDEIGAPDRRRSFPYWTRTIWAASRVPATIASAGVMPNATMLSRSR